MASNNPAKTTLRFIMRSIASMLLPIRGVSDCDHLSTVWLRRIDISSGLSATLTLLDQRRGCPSRAHPPRWLNRWQAPDFWTSQGLAVCGLCAHFGYLDRNPLTI